MNSKEIKDMESYRLNILFQNSSSILKWSLRAVK